MKRLVWSLVIMSALALASVPEASAHGSHYRAYDRHHVVRHSHSYPYWLRRNHEFHRWYLHSHYRNHYYLSWNRLFDIYRYERRYQRPHRRYDRHSHSRHHNYQGRH